MKAMCLKTILASCTVIIIIIDHHRRHGPLKDVTLEHNPQFLHPCLQNMMLFFYIPTSILYKTPQVLYILSKGLVMLNKKVGAYGEVWGEDFVLSDPWLMDSHSSSLQSIAFGSGGGVGQMLCCLLLDLFLQQLFSYTLCLRDCLLVPILYISQVASNK